MLARPLLFALALSLAPLASADDHGGLRGALERKEIVPFRSIVDWIERQYEGQIVEVELDDDDGTIVYEVDLLAPTGDMIEFEFDARSGELRSVRGRDVERARRK